MTPQARDDARYMDLALACARAQLGRTAPNPSVGCVLVHDDRILAVGATADGGRPHAEALALETAGEAARGATAYVTLEPCSFTGRSGACTLRLIEAGVARVVIACTDRHPQVDGRGIAALREAGIEVETGFREAEAEALVAGFFHRLETGRPLVYADLARSGYDGVLEGKDEETVQAELDRLGGAGCNRVRIDPGHPVASSLARRPGTA